LVVARPTLIDTDTGTRRKGTDFDDYI